MSMYVATANARHGGQRTYPTLQFSAAMTMSEPCFLPPVVPLRGRADHSFAHASSGRRRPSKPTQTIHLITRACSASAALLLDQSFVAPSRHSSPLRRTSPPSHARSHMQARSPARAMAA